MKNKLPKTPKAFGNSTQEKFSLEMLTLLNIFRSVSSAGLSFNVSGTVLIYTSFNLGIF